MYELDNNKNKYSVHIAVYLYQATVSFDKRTTCAHISRVAIQTISQAELSYMREIAKNIIAHVPE